MTNEEIKNLLHDSYTPVDAEKLEKMEGILKMYLSSAITDSEMPTKLSAREMQVAVLSVIEDMFKMNKNVTHELRGTIVGFEFIKYLDLKYPKEETIN